MEAKKSLLLLHLLLFTVTHALVPQRSFVNKQFRQATQVPRLSSVGYPKCTQLLSEPDVFVENALAPSTEKVSDGTEQQEKEAPKTNLEKLDSIFQNSPLQTSSKSVAAVAVFTVADVCLKEAFKALRIGFPAPLAGMVALFASLVVADLNTPGKAYTAYSFLNEGAKLLATWLPLFFVPSLVVLPLIDPIPLANLWKLALITTAGWVMSLVSTAKLVQMIPPLYKEESSNALVKTGSVSSADSAAVAPKQAPKPAFSAKQEATFAILSASLGVGSLLCYHLGYVSVAAPLITAFFLMTTASSFVFGSRLPIGFRSKVHPLITCTTVTLLVMKLYTALSFQPMQEVLKGYLTKGSKLAQMGSGDFLLAMLGPSILSFACKMFEHRQLMAKNVNKVLGGCIGGSAFGIFSTAILARVLNVSTSLRLSTVSRQVTTPLAIAMATMLGANVSVAVAMVVITGILGANYGRKLLDSIKVKEPVARGLSMGVSSHGLGTAAMVSEPNAFALSAIGMALTATFSTIIVSIPPVRNALIAFSLQSIKKI